MALGFRNVEMAYQVLNELKDSVLPELSISSFPEDMGEWEEETLQNPETNKVYGFRKKGDGGWENLIFFTKNPSQKLIDKFEELKDKIGNSSINKVYSRNQRLWIFGWF